MLGSLAGRLAGLGDSFSSVLGDEPESPRAAVEEVDLGAGAELLSHFQSGWRRLHEGAEQAGRQADRADRDVAALFGEYDLQWRQVSQLGGLVGQLPELRAEVEGMMGVLAGLEAACQQVEVALLALEDTIDAREAQERQLESRFQLALEQERRRQELEELEQRLEQAYQRKVRDRREAEDASRREVQGRLQAQFEAEMASYKALPPGSRLEVPRQRPNEVSLESVDLDEVGEDAAGLEEFLREDCPGLEPLPRDEE